MPGIFDSLYGLKISKKLERSVLQLLKKTELIFVRLSFIDCQLNIYQLKQLTAAILWSDILEVKLLHQVVLFAFLKLIFAEPSLSAFTCFEDSERNIHSEK